MNSVERIKTALRCGQPDGVPILEFLVDENVAKAAVPGCRDVADCMDRLGFDVVACACSFPPVRHNADGSYVDEWGVTYMPGPEAISCARRTASTHRAAPRTSPCSQRLVTNSESIHCRQVTVNSLPSHDAVSVTNGEIMNDCRKRTPARKGEGYRLSSKAYC